MQDAPMTPSAALARLASGNDRYAANDVETLDEDTAILREGTLGQQRVFAAVLSCTDLAVPVDLVFDQPIGQLHVVKTPGNVATADAIAALDYAATGEGAAAILVLSHSGCAAIATAIRAKPPIGKPGPYAALARAVYEGRGDPAVTARINALVQAAALVERSKPIAQRVQSGKVALVGAYFDAATGRVAAVS